MFSVRALTRAAPRTISRAAAGASLRSSAIARPSLTRTPAAVKALLPTRAAAFSTTVRRSSKEEDVEVDEALSAKLESEIQIEEDIKANEQQPASIKDFLDNSPFELVDTPGQEVVKLIRNYGEEKITISFSIADITNFDPYAEDNLFDEDDLPEESLQSDKQQNPEHDLEGDEDVDEDVDEDAGAPINLSILIEKPGKTAGALNIDATARDGDIVVDNMFFYEDATVARIDSPEAAQKRADVYPGPPFGSLDEDLQVLMERFLEERGINETLAAFVPDYVDVKEQQEYLRWLKNVRTFVDA
ncbi:mitochondrial glyco protein [Trichoderma citrinoviride]|uniref:Mitochondrial glyco protein n=1 Tax=Trichoderma citrinoviride TaxID=58853 RepID=A0A2T4AY37_9HYPO|nr:mitochondrial glyco protein [Trichoderma citrinoviride]PTB61986.1 mitochondrial glyco protein [Trichoderma citrinoviride]